MFQFTRPRGARLENLNNASRFLQVSIHAPTRGATVAPAPAEAGFDVSIHAPARGATPAWTLDRAEKEFQFTRPRGARRCRNPPTPLRCCFNSRAREGRDVPEEHDWLVRVVSIHAPARGATPTNHPTPTDTMFQFTRPRGARRVLERRPAVDMGVSIHAPARGATQLIVIFQIREMFQFTRPRGARHAALCGLLDCASFNSRAREGRDLPFNGGFRAQ